MKQTAITLKNKAHDLLKNKQSQESDAQVEGNNFAQLVEEYNGVCDTNINQKGGNDDALQFSFRIKAEAAQV